MSTPARSNVSALPGWWSAVMVKLVKGKSVTMPNQVAVWNGPRTDTYDAIGRVTDVSDMHRPESTIDR